VAKSSPSAPIYSDTWRSSLKSLHCAGHFLIPRGRVNEISFSALDAGLSDGQSQPQQPCVPAAVGGQGSGVPAANPRRQGCPSLQGQRPAHHQPRGLYPEPAFAIAFKDAAYGFATLQAKNKQLAFMTGIQDKSIQIKGNPALVIWFQGLTKYLKPRKKPRFNQAPQ
jgi:hypothetical protein